MVQLRGPDGIFRASAPKAYNVAFGGDVAGTHPLMVCDSAPSSSACQDVKACCSRNVRSSSLSNIESSAFRACMEHDGIDRGAVDVSKGTGPAQGPARSQKTAHHAKADRGRVGA